jgi:hypothetical protein
MLNKLKKTLISINVVVDDAEYLQIQSLISCEKMVSQRSRCGF